MLPLPDWVISQLHRGTTFTGLNLRMHLDGCKSLGCPSTSHSSHGTFAQAQQCHQSQHLQDLALAMGRSKSSAQNILEEAEPDKGKEDNPELPGQSGSHCHRQ